MLRWPDFGRTTLSNKEGQRKPVTAIPAGQPPSAQVAGTRGTIYPSWLRLVRTGIVLDAVESFV
jgi:hypothetical protein